MLIYFQDASCMIDGEEFFVYCFIQRNSRDGDGSTSLACVSKRGEGLFNTSHVSMEKILSRGFVPQQT
jgi:hypothetical protein